MAAVARARASSRRPPDSSTGTGSTPPASSAWQVKQRYPNAPSTNTFRASRRWWRNTCEGCRSGSERRSARRPATPTGQLRGCPFHSAAVEAAEAMPEVQNIVHHHKQEFIDSLIALVKHAGVRNPRLLGQQLAVLYEGAAALGTSLDDPSPWTHACKAAQILIDQALKT
mgnify:CR=1 FL=1